MLVSGILNPKSQGVHDLYHGNHLPGESRLEMATRMLEYYDQKYPQVTAEFKKYDRGEGVYQFYLREASEQKEMYHGISPVTYKWKPDSIKLRQVEWLMDRKRRVYQEGKIPKTIFMVEMNQLAVLRRNAIVKGTK